jgi:hypothetical protein
MPDQEEPGDVEEVFLIEDIDPESWHTREVYARFGLAVYEGQVLEHEIVNLIVWSGISAGIYRTPDEMETANVEMFSKTMGTVKNHLMKRRVDLGHLEEDLVKAVTLRNFLAHAYFRERAAAFAAHDGRERMIAELESAAAFFRRVDADLTPFTRKIIESFGLLDKLAEIYEEGPDPTDFGKPLPGVA